MSNASPIIASDMIFALENSLCHAVIIDLHGPEANDRVDNSSRVHWGAAIDDGYEDSVLLTVVAAEGVFDLMRTNVQKKDCCFAVLGHGLTGQSCNWRKRSALQKPKRRNKRPAHLHPTRLRDSSTPPPKRTWKELEGSVNFAQKWLWIKSLWMIMDFWGQKASGICNG